MIGTKMTKSNQGYLTVKPSTKKLIVSYRKSECKLIRPDQDDKLYNYNSREWASRECAAVCQFSFNVFCSSFV